MFYEHCGLDWLPLLDGWWGHCCAAHDAAGLNPESNAGFVRCMASEGGPVLALIGGIAVGIGLAAKRLWRAIRKT